MPINKLRIKVMSKYVFTYEENNLNENLKSWVKKLGKKGLDFTKDVWDAAKREKKETTEAIKILRRMIKGEDISDNEKTFLKAQGTDIVKILPLIAISGIPVPVPITPLLIVLGKKYGFDILPNSHTKMPVDKL